jgi:LacI family transcriptional regulator
MGYRPNIAARSLKLNRRLRIGVYFPREIASFFNPLRSGVRAAVSAFGGIQVELVLRTFPRLGQGDVELFAADIEEKFDGILVAPGNPDHIGPTLKEVSRRGIAVVCVASDAPHSERLASIAVDAYVSGAIAAELFSRSIQKDANLAVFAPHLSLLPAIESHEKPNLAYRQAAALLSHKPYPLGIYISTANSLPVLRAVQEKGLLGEVQLITTDLFPELVQFIESGRILATLYQRPFRQGRTALELLLRYLLDGVKPEPRTRLAPHIVLRSNLSLFAAGISEA